jgi:hypothetical protein
MSREAMQIALDALEANLGNWAAKTKAVEVLRQALETEQEPVVDEGYYCVVCGKYIEAVDGVIVHNDIPHPYMAFDDEENPQ